MAFPATTTRYLLFLCNLLFLVSALAVAVIALLVQVSLFQHDYFLSVNWTSPPIIIAIACGIICIVSFCGCCGVIRENRCCLYLFSVLLFVVVIAEIVAAGYVFSVKENISNDLRMRMTNSMKDYDSNNNASVVTRSWDVLQHDFQCCGVKNITDWQSVGKPIPSSCCSGLPIQSKCTINDANKEGCYTRFSQFVQSKALTLAAVVLGVGVVQLLCAVASGLLARHLKLEYEAV